MTVSQNNVQHVEVFRTVQVLRHMQVLRPTQMADKDQDEYEGCAAYLNDSHLQAAIRQASSCGALTRLCEAGDFQR